ncbi:hypothetical protein DFQ27_006330 [Actinomortierella ambigua]|uniref:Thioredoxin n=1 Tax=Actinomortierella ambigua TaxID=1343610 RepID=A0A9P6PZE3_9FUNG|nr:hypothetical protein DFQ27_006330 [Actinomortierella ambigua]
MKNITSLSELKSQFAAAGSRLVVVDFHATWCGPCKHLAPILEGLERKHSTTVFLKVDVDEARDCASEYTVSAMPTIVFVKGGSEVGRVVGADAGKIQALIKQHESSGAFSGTGQTLGGGSSSSAQRGGGASSSSSSGTSTTTSSTSAAGSSRNQGARRREGDLNHAPYYLKVWVALTHLAASLMNLLYRCLQGMSRAQTSLIDSARAATTSSPAETVAGPGGPCQIQVRLLDGSTIKGDFEPSHTVERVQEFVKANLDARGTKLAQFSLMTNFPRV